MHESIEQLVKNLIEKVSNQEKNRNQRLSVRTQKMLLALAYLKASASSGQSSMSKLV